MTGHAEDLYGSFGSTDYKLAPDEFAPDQRIQPSPAAFGAAIGQAEQFKGKTEQDLGARTVDLADKYQGLINESLATNAESQLIMKNSKLKGDFLSKEGMEAASALPGYMSSVSDDSDIRSQLPAGALRMYDMLATRQKANYLSEAQTYTAGQIKRASMDSSAQLINAAMFRANDPDVATNPDKMNDLLGTATYSHGAMLDESTPGIIKGDDGTLKFDENSPDGQYQKQALQNNIDYSHGIIWQNAINSVASQDPVRASQIFIDNKDQIPKEAQVRIESSLTPKLNNHYANGAVNGAMIQAQNAHKEFLLNPPTDSAINAIQWTMQHEGGFVSNDSGKGPTNYGINQEANRDIDVTKLTPEQASKIMHDRYWVPVGADSMSPAMGAVAFDTAVNMGVSKAKQLVGQSGGDPQKLIDLRREEYKRLAAVNPEKYGGALDGWMNRLDDLQRQMPTFSQATGKPATPYATNPNGSPVSQADYYASHKDDILAWGDQMADKYFPGNPTFKSQVRERLNNQMSSAVSAQSAQYRQDNMFIQRAITGQMTNNNPPATYEELEKIPGVREVLDRVWVQDPKYAEGIDTQIQKMARKEAVGNSPNGYETVLRVLQPNDWQNYPNRISSQDHLDKLLGRSDGTGINARDYEDAKKGIEYPEDWKKIISAHMKQIAISNGNIDGQGQQRAMDFYNTVDKIRQNRLKGGDEEEAVNDKDVAEEIAGIAEQYQPARITQIANVAKTVQAAEPIKVTDTASYAAVPVGQQYIDPNGVPRIKH